MHITIAIQKHSPWMHIVCGVWRGWMVDRCRWSHRGWRRRRHRGECGRASTYSRWCLSLGYLAYCAGHCWLWVCGLMGWGWWTLTKRLWHCIVLVVHLSRVDCLCHNHSLSFSLYRPEKRIRNKYRKNKLRNGYTCLLLFTKLGGY